MKGCCYIKIDKLTEGNYSLCTNDTIVINETYSSKYKNPK